MRANNLTKIQVAEIINNFINSSGKEWDWDDFISIPIADPYLDLIRKRCAVLSQEFPPGKNEGFCNEEGVKVLQNYVDTLKENKI